MTLDFVSFAKKYAVAGIVIGIVLLVAMKKLGVFSKIKNMVRPDSKKKVGADGGADGDAEGAGAGGAGAEGAGAGAEGAGAEGAGAEGGTSQENVEDNKGDFTFIPSETFEGERKGYTFKKGDKGTGYYPDTRS